MNLRRRGKLEEIAEQALLSKENFEVSRLSGKGKIAPLLFRSIRLHSQTAFRGSVSALRRLG